MSQSSADQKCPKCGSPGVCHGSDTEWWCYAGCGHYWPKDGYFTPKTTTPDIGQSSVERISELIEKVERLEQGYANLRDAIREGKSTRYLSDIIDRVMGQSK